MSKAASVNRAGKKNEDGGVAERVLDDDKGCAPEKAAEGEREIGAEALRHWQFRL